MESTETAFGVQRELEYQKNSLKNNVMERKTYNFRQVGAYGLGILEELESEGFRFSENVQGEGGAGFSNITDGRATYGIRFGDAGTEYENKIMIVARKMEMQTVPDYEIPDYDLFDFPETPGPAKDAANPQPAFFVPEGHATESRSVRLAAGRKYTRRQLDLMGYHNYGAPGSYVFMNGDKVMYFAKATDKVMNEFMITDISGGQATLAQGNAAGESHAYLPQADTEKSLLKQGYVKQMMGASNVYAKDDIAYFMQEGECGLSCMNVASFSLREGVTYTKDEMEKAGIAQAFPDSIIFAGSGGTERYHMRAEHDGNSTLYTVMSRFFTAPGY